MAPIILFILGILWIGTATTAAGLTQSGHGISIYHPHLSKDFAHSTIVSAHIVAEKRTREPWQNHMIAPAYRALEPLEDFDYRDRPDVQYFRSLLVENRDNRDIVWTAEDTEPLDGPMLDGFRDRLNGNPAYEQPIRLHDPAHPHRPGLSIPFEHVQLDFYNHLGYEVGVNWATAASWVSFWRQYTGAGSIAHPGRLGGGQVVIVMRHRVPTEQPATPPPVEGRTPTGENGTLEGPANEVGAGLGSDDVAGVMLALRQALQPTFHPSFQHDELFAIGGESSPYSPNYTDIGFRLLSEPADGPFDCELGAELDRLQLDIDLTGFSASRRKAEVDHFMQQLKAVESTSSPHDKATALAGLLSLSSDPPASLVRELEEEVKKGRPKKCRSRQRRRRSGRRSDSDGHSRQTSKHQLQRRDEIGFETDDRHELSRAQVEDMHMELLVTGLDRVDPGKNSIKVRDGYISWSGQGTVWKKNKTFKGLGYAGPTRLEILPFVNHFLQHGNWDYCGRDDCKLSASFPHVEFGYLKQRLCISNRPTRCLD